MNITENLQRIKQGKDDIITALQNKGSDIKNDTLINEISNYVDKLEIGGGGDTPSVPTELVPKYDGASVFRINVPTDNYEFAINLCNDATKATYDVDWGDGSLEYGLTTDEQHHTYSKAGVYDVNVYNISKDITLGGSFTPSGLNSNVGLSLETGYLLNNSNNDFWGGSYIEKKDNICTNVLIGNGITSIGNKAFKDIISLQNIIISDNVTSIGNYAFSGCKGLSSIIIPNNITDINSSAFSGCYSLHSINIPDSVTSIKDYTYNYCITLQNIVIPDSVTSIGNQAFYASRPLQSIICKSVTPPTISKYSFPSSSYQYTKRYLYVPKDSVGYNEEGSLWKTYLIDYGWELRYIEDKPEKTPTTLKLKTKNNFFHNLQAIGQANLIDYELINDEYIYNFDDKIIELIQYTFYNNVLEGIELPECVEIIGSFAFSNTYYLQTITCKALTAPTIQSNTFQNVGTSVSSGTKKVLRVPEGSDYSTWLSKLSGFTIEYIPLDEL